MKYLIADLVTEFEPKYNILRTSAKPFEYCGPRKTDIVLSVSDEHLKALLNKMTADTTVEEAEELAFASAFNRSIISHNGMLVHSSAIEYRGKAYLFSASSGVGKSTHTALWRKAFGSDVKIINDDKPVVRFSDEKPVVFGTPFNGGSGLSDNISAPLGAVVFLERGESNSVRKPDNIEIIKRLYFSTARFVSKSTADKMIENIERLINCSEFYVLSCSTDISAAIFARNFLIK